ncbi:MAG: DUF4209 domain-containing protein [Clostridiales bacterium]|nr:DUF4209 domain-containing protein [Clostridiales bacterium]
MTVYEALNQIETKPFVLFGTDAFQCDMAALDTENDRCIYNLIKDVCSLHAKISAKNIEFQPSIVLMGKRSFSLQDMTEKDFLLLESLDISLLPLSIRARVADLLWTEKGIYTDALIAIDTYVALFNLLFSDGTGLETLDIIRRALSIATQVNQKEKHDTVCKMLYNHILRIDGGDDSFLSLQLIEMMISEKYGASNALIAILNKIVPHFDSNIPKVEMAYKLLNECFKWKKDDLGIYNTNIAMAQYYEKKSSELTDDEFRSLIIAEGYLKKAVFLYRQNGEAKQAERLQKEIVQLQSKIPQTIGFVQRGYDVSNLYEYMVECFDGLSFQEALLRLIRFTTFHKKEDVKKDVLDELKEHSLSHLFKKVFTNSTGQTVFTLDPLDMHDPGKDQKLLAAHIHQQLFRYENIAGDLCLRRALEIIRDKYDVHPHDLDFLVLDNPIIPQGRERIFRSAIYMALKGQEYEAIHILSSQMENLFRNLARELGALTVTLENDGTSKEKLLTSVFDLPELVDAYDNDILFLFEGLLNEQVGANIRDNAAHGLLTESSARSGACVYFICAAIRLLSYTSSGCMNLLINSSKVRDLKPPIQDITPILSSESNLE